MRPCTLSDSKGRQSRYRGLVRVRSMYRPSEQDEKNLREERMLLLVCYTNLHGLTMK